MPIDLRMLKWDDAPAAPQIDPRMVRWQDVPQEPVKIGADAFPDTLRETLRNTDWGTRNIAGAGTALSNLWEGVKQFAGQGDPRQIEAQRIIGEEAPVGHIAGEVAATALPFASVKTIGTAAKIGAGYGLLQPVDGSGAGDIIQGKATNAALGGAFAAGGQAVANKASQYVANKVAQAATATKTSEPIRSTIKEAVDAGYSLPPGQVKPTWINKRLESASGKIATQQVFSERNQAVTDNLARKAAGLMPDEPITPESLKAARDAIKQPYQEISSLGLGNKLDELDALRAEANAAWREYNRQGTRAALKDYHNFRMQATGVESNIETTLKAVGRPDLMQKFREARIALAKNHDVETALIEGGGQVDARVIGRMLQRGDKMTGELATIGKFANNFPKVVQPDKAMGTPDAHNLRHWLSLGSGAAGMVTGGPLLGLATAVAVESMPYAARAAMFSRPVQQSLSAAPTVAPAIRMGGGLLGNAPVGATVLGLESLRQ